MLEEWYEYTEALMAQLTNAMENNISFSIDQRIYTISSVSREGESIKVVYLGYS